MLTVIIRGLVVGVYALFSFNAPADIQQSKSNPAKIQTAQVKTNANDKKVPDSKYKTAIFAGGCFWCVESDFDKVEGVVKTISGYTGGSTDNPTYKSVTYGNSGHYEAVEVTYDPEKVSYKKLLFYFWRTVDPTDDGGQFCDRGHSYKTAIFTNSKEQFDLATASKETLIKEKTLSKPIVTPILKAGSFYPAETYHQDYYKKNPIRYNYYRFGCKRDARIKQVWGKQAHGGLK